METNEAIVERRREAVIHGLIQAREELHVSQRELERLSGVRRSIIARMELGLTKPQIDNVLSLLAPLGKTLAIVPLEAVQEAFEHVPLAGQGIDASRLRAALVEEIINVRQEQNLSQKKLEELSGVKQPIIARMEKGITSPQLDTVIKLLVPLGKTLAIVPLDSKQ